jgi:Holliday junction resolvase
MAAEAKIQKKIKDFLEKEGAYVVNAMASKSGVPDLTGCYKGRYFGVEVKTPQTKNNVSKLQQYNLDKIVDAGGFGIVAWEIEQIEKLLEEINAIN